MPAVQRDQAVAGREQNGAVRYQDHGPLPAESGESVAKLGFGLAVEARRRLVQQQDRRIADQGAGDGNALALAARHASSGFAD